MCGLVGMAGRMLSDKHTKLFQQMLVASTMRGRDSTGVATVRREYRAGKNYATTRILKNVGSPFDLYENRQFDNVMREHSIKALIGHTRSATKGIVTRGNAHPFDVGNIVGAHNGTINERQPDEELYGTDSECMYANINDKGLKEYLSTIRGAWALTFWNYEDETLNFLRNSERPLAIAIDKANHNMYWASEPAMLYWLLSRNEVPYTDLFNLPVDTHIAFKLMDQDWTNTGVANEVKQREVTVNPVAPFPEARDGGHKQAFPSREEATASATNTSPQQSQEVPVKTTETPSTTGSKIASVPATVTSQDTTCTTQNSGTSAARIKHYRGFQGMELSMAKHYENLEDGCAWCGGIASMAEPVRYITKRHYFCEDCKNHPDVLPRVDITLEQIANHSRSMH